MISFVFCVLGSGFRVSGLRFGVQGFTFRVFGFIFSVSVSVISFGFQIFGLRVHRIAAVAPLPPGADSAVACLEV